MWQDFMENKASYKKMFKLEYALKSWQRENKSLGRNFLNIDSHGPLKCKMQPQLHN